MNVKMNVRMMLGEERGERIGAVQLRGRYGLAGSSRARGSFCW